MSELCGYTLVDAEGEEYPCDKPATGWRWYQDVEHEDCLSAACADHENEGGRRLHAAETEVERLTRAEVRSRRGRCTGCAWCCQSTLVERRGESHRGCAS